MARKSTTAVKEQQPDLLGGAQPSQAPNHPIAKVEPKPRGKNKTGEVVAMPTLIDRLKQVSSAADVAIAKEILAMIRAEEDRVAEKAFNADMLLCQSALPIVKKSSFNKHTKSYWARLEAISKVVDPIIRKHGFTLSYGGATSPLPEHYRVVCDVSHRDGHTRRYEADVGMDSKGPKGEGNKSLAQGSGSSISYARRYLKVMIFDIVIEGEDNDGNGSRGSNVIDAQVAYEVDPTVPKITQKQADDLMDLLQVAGKTSKQFCMSWKIEKLADLPAEFYSQALSACKALAKKAQG